MAAQAANGTAQLASLVQLECLLSSAVVAQAADGTAQLAALVQLECLPSSSVVAHAADGSSREAREPSLFSGGCSAIAMLDNAQTAKISSYTSANLPIHSSYQVAQAILDWDKDKGREDKDTGDATMECYVQL